MGLRAPLLLVPVAALGLVLAQTRPWAVGGDRPAKDDKAVSKFTYGKDVAPLLTKYCNGCHGGARPKANLDAVPVSGEDQGSTSRPIDLRLRAVWATLLAVFFTVPPTVFTLTFMPIYLTGTFHSIQAAIGDMVGAGWGRIVTISSAAGQTASPRQAHYSASKGGVIALTEQVQFNSYSPTGIEQITNRTWAGWNTHETGNRYDATLELEGGPVIDRITVPNLF